MATEPFAGDKARLYPRRIPAVFLSKTELTDEFMCGVGGPRQLGGQAAACRGRLRRRRTVRPARRPLEFHPARFHQAHPDRPGPWREACGAAGANVLEAAK
eukprot:4888090-Alexandrium_andersonii.AAC.1